MPAQTIQNVPTRRTDLATMFAELGEVAGKWVEIRWVQSWQLAGVERVEDYYELRHEPVVRTAWGLVLRVETRGSCVAVWLGKLSDGSSEWVTLRAEGEVPGVPGQEWAVTVTCDPVKDLGLAS